MGLKSKDFAVARRMVKAEFKAIADHALLVQFSSELNEDAHDLVVALDRVLADAPPPGLIELVPALVNLLVDFDPLLTDHKAIEADIRNKLKQLEPTPHTGTLHRVPVCYEAPFCPDLSAVARQAGMSEDAVINAHIGGDYRVMMYGFAPGFAYLTGVPQPIQVPRKPTPVRDVPGCSVIIAGPQCLITTLVMPTGWSIIGRATVQTLTDDPDRPFLFDIADQVQFERIDLSHFDKLTKEAAHG